MEATLPDDPPFIDDAPTRRGAGAEPGAKQTPSGTTSELPGNTPPPSSGGAPTPPIKADGGTTTDSGSKTDGGVTTGGGSSPGTGGSTTSPPSTPFRRIDVRYPVDANLFIAQCTLDAKAQLVWKTTAAGTDAYARWAEPAYSQQPNVFGSCGSMVSGQYPIVLSSLAGGSVPAGTYLARCAEPGTAHVYRVAGEVDGHPAATFSYPEQHPACD